MDSYANNGMVTENTPGFEKHLPKKFGNIDPRKGNQNRRRGHAKRAPSVNPGRPKVGRNDLCPCGSGKKFKKCCLGDDGPKLTGKTLPVKTQ